MKSAALVKAAAVAFAALAVFAVSVEYSLRAVDAALVKPAARVEVFEERVALAGPGRFERYVGARLAKIEQRARYVRYTVSLVLDGAELERAVVEVKTADGRTVYVGSTRSGYVELGLHRDIAGQVLYVVLTHIAGTTRSSSFTVKVKVVAEPAVV